MNIFVLSTGRCGSTTFIQASRHITNYTSAHESRHGLVGEERLNFVENHIEADNRLSWFLGRLDKVYGDNAFYVHLTRDTLGTAKSYLKRYDTRTVNIYDYSIINPYSRNIIGGNHTQNQPIDICLDYCETVNSNIELFLKNKTNKMHFNLENAKEDFKIFWDKINAEGDFSAAFAEWDVPHNKAYTPEMGSRFKRKMKHLMAVLFE